MVLFFTGFLDILRHIDAYRASQHMPTPFFSCNPGISMHFKWSSFSTVELGNKPGCGCSVQNAFPTICVRLSAAFPVCIQVLVAILGIFQVCN